MGHTITRERWVSHALDPVERPNILYEYYVSGRGEFCWDMLRHDHCWPATGNDAVLMQCYPGPGYNKLRSIRMRSYQPPTIARWDSMGWSAGLHNLNE